MKQSAARSREFIRKAAARAAALEFTQSFWRVGFLSMQSELGGLRKPTESREFVRLIFARRPILRMRKWHRMYLRDAFRRGDWKSRARLGRRHNVLANTRRVGLSNGRSRPRVPPSNRMVNEKQRGSKPTESMLSGQQSVVGSHRETHYFILSAVANSRAMKCSEYLLPTISAQA